MPNGTIFFSYSRADQKFVLELAKKLRKIGADIWIDQLDIEAGRNWDKSVERALESSDSVLVVMSKSSVESVNVMDEVSIAIEEGKNVIPLLLEECKRPFRLKRRHYVDFTDDKDKAFEILVATLKLNQENNKSDVVEIVNPERKDPPSKISAKESETPIEGETEKLPMDKKAALEKREQEEKRAKLEKIERERIKKELDVEKARLQKIEDDRIKKEQEEETIRLRKGNEERIKKEQEVEKLRLQKVESDRLKREEEIRIQTKNEIEEKYKVKAKKNSRSGLIISIVVVLILIATSAGWYFLSSQDKMELITEEAADTEVKEETEVKANEEEVAIAVSSDPDTASYDSIKSSMSFADFDAHMTRIDSCKHIIVIDNSFWAMAQDSSVTYGHQDYLENFPEGENVEEAQQRIKEIQDEMIAFKTDSLTWAKAKAKNDVSSLLGYLILDTLNGNYRNEALQTAGEIGKKGWLFIGRSNNESKMNIEGRVFDIVCCDKTEGAADKVPVKNDILKAKSQRRIYSEPTDAPVTGSINKNRLAQVLEVKPIGNVIYVQILY